MNAQPLSNTRFGLSEGILWDDRLEVLWWTDIHAATLWQYHPAHGIERHWSLPERLGCFALTQDTGVLLLGLEQGLARFDTTTGELNHLVPVAPDQPAHRVNDGRCDRAGNFVFGTLNEGGSDKTAGFYRYTRTGELQRLSLPGVAISNSICFSPDGGTMYFCDSPARRILACDYDAASGQTGNIRVFVDLGDGHADPDGAIVDADGCLWSAEWGGSRVARYDPDGRLLQAVALPTGQITCLTLGGTALDTLYVTSAAAGMSDAARVADMNAGAVFHIADVGARGLPECRFG
ncbi:SMP-30/gluconolactonase/LRE family protein [Chitiniphilus eburneus]|uniref:SMP-30/gluconolactonase/LRE family protein n=1 Tax=Chitiniphilus eburneus TaxID=2571148 RepID=A0A4U0QDE2_9NEIS|nr:SMP-30/gluconolactonase/LRE family protein [Chitiniphilus eburneus]TJZ73874.1 SMP-30/gluconolactonase/LRE family protein [Chitiniphilus eburneus]